VLSFKVSLEASCPSMLARLATCDPWNHGSDFLVVPNRTNQRSISLKLLALAVKIYAASLPKPDF
jgi:hypothetical protein